MKLVATKNSFYNAYMGNVTKWKNWNKTVSTCYYKSLYSTAAYYN